MSQVFDWVHVAVSYGMTTADGQNSQPQWEIIEQKFYEISGRPPSPSDFHLLEKEVEKQLDNASKERERVLKKRANDYAKAKGKR